MSEKMIVIDDVSKWYGSFNVLLCMLDVPVLFSVLSQCPSSPFVIACPRSLVVSSVHVQ